MKSKYPAVTFWDSCHIWPPDGSRVQLVNDCYNSAWPLHFTHFSHFSLSLCLLQCLHVDGKGQGKWCLLQMDYTWSGSGHPSAHVCYNQQVQTWAQGVCCCDGERQVWPIWTLQWSCNCKHTWLVWKKIHSRNTSSYCDVWFSHFAVEY